MSDALSKYYEKAFASAGEGGSIYTPMSVLERAGHERKSKLLDEIDIPDLTEATVVDYGVGSWGFGCVFPKIKKCKTAIGVDISQYAIDCSRKLSESDPDLSGTNLSFITSTGYDIKLSDHIADIVFAGECIEHIEDTDAFLGEIFRIMKPDGIAIFTTPNASPYLYGKNYIRWAMGFEHVALMDSDMLLRHLGKFFEIEEVKGYSSTLSPEVDALVDNAEYAAEIAMIGASDFRNASGLIVKVRKSGTEFFQATQKCSHVIVESSEVQAHPEARDLSLFEDTFGRMATGESSFLTIPVPDRALRCHIVLWSHPWSGIARIEAAKFNYEVDLYSHVSGCVRVSIEGESFNSSEQIRIYSTGKKRGASQGCEVIFFRAVFSVGS